MSEDHQDDENAEIEAEIQRELEALSLEDEDEADDQTYTGHQEEDTETEEFSDKMPDCISDFIQRVQSRADDFQKELSECDSLLATVATANEEETEEFFYQSKLLKEFAFQIGEDPEELRDKVIHELTQEDEEDSKPLSVDGPGVKVLALEGPLFEEQDVDPNSDPLPALEGPKANGAEGVEGMEVALTEGERGLQVYVEPVQQFEGVARQKVKEFEDRFGEQLLQYQRDYEEGQRSNVQREKQAEEDRARRRRENDEEQRQLAQERMLYQSKIQEKLEELEKNTKESLENYQNEIKKLEERTNQERKEFEEQFSQHQRQIAEKRSLSATKIQAVYRSYRARKPFLKKMRLIREEVKKKMIDKRQMEIAAKKRQEEQKKKKEREEKKRKEEEMRRKVEEEKKRQEEEEKREQEKLETERLEKERRDREEMEMRRAEEERKEEEQREMEEKANEILAKIMKENESQKVGDNRVIQPAVKVNIIDEGDMNMHYANEGSMIPHVKKNSSDDGMKSGVIEEERKDVEEQRENNADKHVEEELKDSLGEEIVVKLDVKNGRENLSECEAPETDNTQLTDTDSRDKIVNSELNAADKLKQEDGKEHETTGNVQRGGETQGQSAIEGVSLNLNINNGKFRPESARIKGKIYDKSEEDKGLKRNVDIAKHRGAETGVQLKNDKSETERDQESSERKNDSGETKKMVGTSDLEEGMKGNADEGGMKNVTNMSKNFGKQDAKDKEKALDSGGVAKMKDFESEVAMVTSSNAPPKLDVLPGSGSSHAGSKKAIDEEYREARLEWMKKSIPFSKQLIQAKDRLHELEKKKRRYLRKPSAVKKLTEISEEQLLAASSMANSLAEIRTVELQDLPGCTLTTLSRCPNLRAFSCHSSKIECLEGLDQSPDICYIDVKGNQLASTNCRDWKILTFLDLSENNLTTIQGLEGCTSLKWLSLSYNKLSRLNGIEYLLSLVHLDVSNNQLINCQGLSSLVHLVRLDASNNHLSTLPSLDSCVLLKKLNLRGNSISEVPNFPNHVLLTELFLDNNSLVSMETIKLSWLPRLHCLSLSQNSLKDVPVLKYALLLKKLDLRNNYITDVSSLSDGLTKLPYLQHLHVSGNPVTEERECRAEILKLVPSLQYLEDEALPSPASQQALSEFEEMCLSQITAEDALRQRHLDVIQSLKADGRHLQNVAKVWSAYLDFRLKMAIDHRYMHEYGDLSPVTCEVKELCRMIPEPDSEQRQSLEETRQGWRKGENGDGFKTDLNNAVRLEGNRQNLMKQENKEGIKTNLNSAVTRSASHVTTESGGVAKGDSGQSLHVNQNDSRVGSGDKMSVPPSLSKQASVRSEEGKVRQNAAATRIQALWRGFEVRKDLELHTKRYLAAVLIQSVWRGHSVRQRYVRARAALQNQKSEEGEEEFDFNEDLDLEFLEYSEENLEKGWMPSEIPNIPSPHPVLPPKHCSKISPYQERPVSTVSSTSSPSPEKFAPHPPKQAWRGTNSPLAPIGNHGSVPQEILSGKPPLPPVTPASSRVESLSNSTARTIRSKKEQELSEEWGFKDNNTTELMMRRAKKMNQVRKKKNLDPIKKYQMFKKLQESQQPLRETQHQSKRGIQRKEYFKAKEEAVEERTREVRERTYEWVHAQTAYSNDGAAAADLNQTFRSRHSSSEPNLPRMSPDVLQGRVHLTASPAMDVQSIDGSSINGVTIRGRSNSFSSPDGDRPQLPPIKTNSAPSSHVRQRQAAKVSQHEGAYNTRQAWGRPSQGKKR